MFLLLTLVAIAFAWLNVQLNWIKERHRVLANGLDPRFLSSGETRAYDLYSVFPRFPDEAPVDAPWGLRLLGENGVSEMVVAGARPTAAEGEEVQRLFPEARVRLLFDRTLYIDPPTVNR
jgi:hypothetical protein